MCRRFFGGAVAGCPSALVAAGSTDDDDCGRIQLGHVHRRHFRPVLKWTGAMLLPVPDEDDDASPVDFCPVDVKGALWLPKFFSWFRFGEDDFGDSPFLFKSNIARSQSTPVN
jgi:hypothetical protein